MNARVGRKVWLSVGATVGLLAVVWLVGTALAQGPEGEVMAEGDVSLAAMVADKINYQGRLTDSVGAPLNGTFPMQFQIYDDAALGTMLWDSGTISVDVDHGLFNVELAVDPTDFDGQELWVRIYVDGDWLSPRQELLPVPYALSLRPGAEIKGYPPSTCSAVLNVELDGVNSCAKAVSASVATGWAIFGTSAGGFGLRGYSDTNWAVVGASDTGTAGNFQSNEGIGIRVSTNGSAPWDYAGYFSSNMGYGVYVTSAQNMGVRAEAGDVSGLSRAAGTAGVVGIGENGGVYGSSGTSYGVFASTQSGTAVQGRSNSGDLIRLSDGSPSNLRFRVDNAGDVYADRAYHCGLNDGGNASYIDENTGCMYDVDPADFAEMLPVANDPEPGDVLVIGSDGRLGRSTEPYQSTVAGVYSARPSYVGNAAKWGQDGYAPLAVVGLVRVKACAENGPIQPGDLLVTSSTPGHAMRAGDNPQVGTVLGKALEPLEAGTASLLVLVTLQ